MSITFAGLWMAAMTATPLGDAPAVELNYAGTLSPITRSGVDTPVKRFDLYCLFVNDKTDGRSLAFLVDEFGGGGWAWPERFGRIPLDASNRPANQTRIRLLHDHQGTNYPIALRQPLFEHADKIKEGASWTVGKDRYEVRTREKIAERDCWRIDVIPTMGGRQTVWVERGSPLVVRAERRLFMGQGEPFLLEVTLDSLSPADADRLRTLQPPLQTLLTLQKDLGRADNEEKPELSDAQLATAAAVLDQFKRDSKSTPFNRLAEAIDRDVELQTKRSGDVAKLTKTFVGQPAPKLALKTLTGKTVAPEATADKIVLLHFWSYNDDPLVEPYGQVGYLDFLNSRRQKLGVHVYGVAVNSRLADDNQAPPVLRSIRKLKSFMNLGYPVTLDDGTLLKQFGDPRQHGAKLPLWVVIGPDGKIVHYKVGFYDIKPDEGLRELDDVIAEQIKKQRRIKN